MQEGSHTGQTKTKICSQNSFDKPKEEIKAKPKPSVPVNVKKSVGVKSDKQSKITSYDDIDVGSFFNT